MVIDLIFRRLCVNMIMCGGGVHSILLLPLLARCLETIDVWDRTPREPDYTS